MFTTILEKDQNALLRKAGEYLCGRVRDLLSVQPHVNLAVPGGRSVSMVFRFMREVQLDWRRVHFFCVDERLVPINHPDSNFKLLRDNLIDPLVLSGRFPAGNSHPFVFEPTANDFGTRRYESLLADYGFRYDIVLLSAGEDGHVGALFPNHHSIMDAHHGFIVMRDAPKPPPGRMTSSRSLLQTAKSAVLLFVGESKREAYRMFLDSSLSLEACPAKLTFAVTDVSTLTDLC